MVSDVKMNGNKEESRKRWRLSQHFLLPLHLKYNQSLFIMRKIQSGPYLETLKQIETVQLCQNQSYQIVEWE